MGRMRFERMIKGSGALHLSQFLGKLLATRRTSHEYVYKPRKLPNIKNQDGIKLKFFVFHTFLYSK